MSANGHLRSWIPAKLQRSKGSLRTQLILWNVVSLSLLLGSLGIASRFAILSFMMQSVDRELEHNVERFERPPPIGPPRISGGRFRPPGLGPGEGPGPGERPGQEAMMAHGERPRPDQAPQRGIQIYGNGPGPGGGPPGEGRRPPRPPDANDPFRPHVFNASGQSDWPGEKRPVWDKAALQRALHGETVWTTVTVDDEPVRVISSPGFDHLRRKAAVQSAYPLKEVNRAISGIDTALLLLIPVGLLGAGWMGSVLTNRILRRVQWMTQAAGSIGGDDCSKRLPVSGNDEFAELADTFNGLLGRLDASFQEQTRALELQRRFTADASHELKTPLTIVKGNTSLAFSKASINHNTRHTLTEIDKAADTMSQLVQDLLLLARSDAGQLGGDRIEMLVREVLDTAVSQSSPNGGLPVRLTVEPEDLCVKGNEAELVRVFRNLLDNALRHTPSDGSIPISAPSSHLAASVTLY